MIAASFVLIDRLRAEQFTLLGRSRQLFNNFDLHFDSEGIAWALSKAANHTLAFTWLGGGWVFDRYASRIWAVKRAECLHEMRQADGDSHRQQLGLVFRQLRLGPSSERLLWFIHQQVIQARSSVIKTADSALAAAVWGRKRDHWPRQWRQDLASMLKGLTWLHLGQGPPSGTPSWGMNTALVTHAADLRNDPEEDTCAELCPETVSVGHHHFLINVGRGFLGLLEQFGREDESTGIRRYEFPISGPRHSGPTLKRAGKTGRLVSIYLPARLGEPARCRRLSAPQHRLLQALVRETTRSPKSRRSRLSELAVIAGRAIPKVSGKGTISCSALDPDVAYVGFNGNGKRSGLGYYLTTPGGWLTKAGYGPAEIGAFLTDLAVLQNGLGLTVVGIEKSSEQCHDLDHLRAMAAAAVLHAPLERVFVRIYTRADYAERWDRLFEWQGLTPESYRPLTQDLIDLVSQMRRQGISRRALANGIGLDPSFLSKLLNGKKSWPGEVLAKARAWLAGTGQETRGPPVAPWPSLPTLTGAADTSLAVALSYRERGWSVVPQRPGDKKPTIRWKPYQDALPSIADLQNWFRQWPSAGLAVVLGPVSDLFVIDVDGPEAHAAFLSHLGKEPVAPKAISGSRKPYRYHLFFRCPDCSTKAKATPWHPQLEFRGKGGIVVIPPSQHKSGNRYEWAAGQSPADLPFPEVPSPILAALQKKKPLRQEASIRLSEGLEVSPATRRFLSGVYAEGPQWNERLFQAGCDLAGRNVPQETATALLLAGARPWNESERDNALRTIGSAYGQPRVPGTA